jgi:hypothetical protein
MATGDLFVTFTVPTEVVIAPTDVEATERPRVQASDDRPSIAVGGRSTIATSERPTAEAK